MDLPGFSGGPLRPPGPGSAAWPAWYAELARFERPRLRSSIWQLLNSVIPYLLIWVAMAVALRAGLGYGWVLLMAVPGGLFLIRTFILFHDCTHLSFFASKRACRVVGHALGIVTFTPYERWGGSHWTHHATVADLDRRGHGDVWTMTADEYRSLPRRGRVAYRMFRNPWIFFLLGPLFSFVIYQRFYFKGVPPRVTRSIHITNAGVLALAVAGSLAFGFRTFVLVQAPLFFFGGMAGFWLFYIQHQFPGVYWARHDAWDRTRAAMEGASFYKLPRVLDWFTGSIGYHHLHHVRPRIPNYNLRAAFASEPALRAVRPVTFFGGFRSLRYRLYDERAGRLIGFRQLRKGSRANMES